MFKFVTLLALLPVVFCENFTSYNCDEAKCVEASVAKPSQTSWSIQLEDAIVGWHLSIQIFMVSNVKANLGIGYTSTKDFIMILNGNTNAAIVVTKRKAYLIDQCKTKMSFKDVTASKDTFLGVYKDDVVPKIGKFSDGFLLRPLFIHLYGNQDVKGAPGLNQELQDRLGKSFGDVFEKLHQAYKSKSAFVYQYEAGILGLLLGGAEHQTNLRTVMTPMIVFRIVSNNDLSATVYEGITKTPGTFADFGVRFWYSQSLYKFHNEVPSDGQFVATDVTVKDNKGGEYYLSYGTDNKKKLYEIKLRKLDGTMDTSILTNPDMDAWSFLCRITDLYLVMSAKVPKYGLFQASTGASILVDKSTQRAVTSNDNSKGIVLQYIDYFDYKAIIEMLRVLFRTKVEGDQTFSFNSFIKKAHGGNGLATLKASDKTKEELKKNFNDFIDGFKSVEAYDCHYKSANVVLYFFRNISIPYLKEDYRNMVRAVGVNPSIFNCDEIIYATNLCIYNRFVKTSKTG